MNTTMMQTIKRKYSALLLWLSAILTPLPWGGVGGGLLGGLLLTSCGELFELNGEDAPLGQLTVSRDSVDLMVGDWFKLPVTVSVGENVDGTLHFESPDNDIVQLRGDTIEAVAPGELDVTVEAASGQLKDSCHVTVHAPWVINSTDFQYDMVVFATVTVNGHAPDNNTIVGAFTEDDGQLRGVGRMMSQDGQDYMLLRIYSPDNSNEPLVLRCYDRSRAMIVEAESTIVFSGDDTIGTLSGLYNIEFE